MPLLHITTNQTVSDTKALASDASALVAHMLGKPESYVMVKVDSGACLLFAGSDAPAAHLKLKSLGLPEERTTEFSQTLCQFIADKLEIDSNRIYIEFSGPARHLWGWDNRTF